MARPVPVFPDVGSTIVPPGRRSPEASAASMSATATRSLIEPPGLRASTLATSCGTRPGRMRLRRTSGVWPMASRIESLTSARTSWEVVDIEPVWQTCGVMATAPKILRHISADAGVPSLGSVMLPAMPNDRDAVDRRILELLAGDARISNAALAEQVGIAPSTCLTRVRALREAGIIQGFHAEIDLAALGRPLQAMIAIRLSVHDREQIEAFTQAVRALPGVLSVFHMTGVNDYLVWVAARDTQDLREFVVDHLATHAAVAHAETSLIYEHKRGPGIWGAADPA